MSSKKIERDENKISVSPLLLNRIFQSVLERKFTEAERNLEKIRAKIEKKDIGEFERGFMRGLTGIILMHRSNSPDTFLNNLNPKNTKVLKKYYEEFSKNAENKLHAPYDRGYFSALTEYMRFMVKRAKPGRKTKK